ncbi:MAG: hypothetical protein IKA46_01780 [Clostridia bacterium]|nr:hypothetical protein [Clostridia bacterium]
MAINWNWKDKIGELAIKQGDKHFTINVYKCNGLAIFIHEFTNDEGVEQYNVYNFFCDKEHFRRCAKSFNYADEWIELTLWEVPNDFWIILKDLVKRNVKINLIPKETGAV